MPGSGFRLAADRKHWLTNEKNAMKNARLRMLLVALVATRLVADGLADDALKYWPQWRGPR